MEKIFTKKIKAQAKQSDVQTGERGGKGGGGERGR